jgi:hypothetical protein
VVIAGGADLDRVVEFSLKLGPLGAALGDAGPDVTARISAAVREAVAPFATARGVVMPSAAWVVTARA